VLSCRAPLRSGSGADGRCEGRGVGSAAALGGLLPNRIREFRDHRSPVLTASIREDDAIVKTHSMRKQLVYGAASAMIAVAAGQIYVEG